MRYPLGVVVILLAMTIAAVAKDVSGWDVTAQLDNGRFESCSMAAKYERGNVVSLVLVPQKGWGMAFYNPRWNLKKNAKLTVTASVDDNVIADTEAVAIADNVLLVPFSGADAYTALQAGNKLRLVGKFINEGYSLSGTRNAMNAVLECVSAGVKLADNAPKSSGGGTPTANQARPLPSLEAYHMISNMLSASGISGYRMDRPDEGGFISWTYASGVRGVFTAFTNATGSNDADEVIKAVIADRSSKCEGKFGSQKKSTPTDNGTMIRQLILICADGAANDELQLSVIQRRDGLLFMIGHNRALGTGNSQGQGQNAAGSREEISRTEDILIRQASMVQ